MNEKRKLRYPILLVHGLAFRDHKYLNYWGRIPKRLEELGAQIFYGNQDGNGTIEDNGLFLMERINEILEQTGASKVNIIAHSKGGIDCRYMISHFNMGKKVASLTTIATPHHGCKILDKVPRYLLRVHSIHINVLMKLTGDKRPKAYKAYNSLKESYMEDFNKKYLDDPSVYYQSYAFSMQKDVILWLFHKFINKYGENDGQVTVESAKWGDFKGVYRSNSKRGISHAHEIDMYRKKMSKKDGPNISDILEIYEKIYNDLCDKDF